jgi:elongation factor P
MLAKEVKPGTVVTHDGNPVLIRGVKVQSPSARGAATLYLFTARDLISKQKINLKLKGTDVLDLADFSRRQVKLMYTDQTHVHLLDQQDFNQFTMLLEDAEDELQYVTEDLEGIYALIFNDECVGIELPAQVELNITQCDPAVKGNSATSRTKPATLQTGLVVHVPEYMKEGERVKVDTRTGEFLSRVQ